MIISRGTFEWVGDLLRESVVSIRNTRPVISISPFQVGKAAHIERGFADPRSTAGGYTTDSGKRVFAFRAYGVDAHLNMREVARVAYRDISWNSGSNSKYSMLNYMVWGSNPEKSRIITTLNERGDVVTQMKLTYWPDLVLADTVVLRDA